MNPMAILVLLAIFSGLEDEVPHEGKSVITTEIFLGSLG